MSYRRSHEDTRRLIALARETARAHHYTPRGAFYSDIKGRYLQFYTSDWGGKYVRWLKRHCNRKVRHYPILLQRGQYRRVSEFWCTLY